MPAVPVDGGACQRFGSPKTGMAACIMVIIVCSGLGFSGNRVEGRKSDAVLRILQIRNLHNGGRQGLGSTSNAACEPDDFPAKSHGVPSGTTKATIGLLHCCRGNAWGT